MTEVETHNVSANEAVTPHQTTLSPAPNQHVRRLGIRELGWHAYEKAMPSRVLNRIEAGQEIEIAGIVPVLARLCEQNVSIKTAYLCHSSVRYITKSKGEGSFCGYRNIQMLISYVIGCNSMTSPTFPNGIPSILQLQDLIEDAWDRGINPEGRVETGGIRGTRKHIGTPEAQALFKGAGIPSSVKIYKRSPEGVRAWTLLLDFVQEYFSAGSSITSETKVYRTDLPPIYLQRPYHSLTIIGYEILDNGKCYLLVLDPAGQPDPRMVSAAQAGDEKTSVNERISMKPYLRGERDVGRYKKFETLVLT